MRNVFEYPITSAEVIEASEQALDHMTEHLEKMIGTTVPYSLQLLCEFIREEESALIMFLEQRQKK
jgi:hypothetical protein